MLTGWGRYKKYNITMLKPKNLSNLQTILNNKIESKNFIVRGLGRSYGDSSIGENVICLSNFKKKIQLNGLLGILLIISGVYFISRCQN